MIVRFLPITLLFVSGCINNHDSQCVYTNYGSIRIDRTVGNALDGTDYRICSLLASGQCSTYNIISMLRPLQIVVGIEKDHIRVTQTGGSVESYVTDPHGLLDRNFRISKGLYFNFEHRQVNGAPLLVSVLGRPVKTERCRS